MRLTKTDACSLRFLLWQWRDFACIAGILNRFCQCPASSDTRTKEIWIYDFRTNVHFTLKQHPMTEADLEDFVSCYHQEKRREAALICVFLQYSAEIPHKSQ